VFDAASQAAGGRKLDAEQESLLSQVIGATTVANDQRDKEAARGEIDLLIDRVLAGQVKLEGRVEKALRLYIDELDKKISAQVNAILHDPKFQRLESTWRSIQYVVKGAPIKEDIKLRVLNVTKDELLDDFDNAVDFDQSIFYKKTFEQVYETSGGEPYAALVGDYEFNASSTDVKLLGKLAGACAMGHAPFLAAASAQMFKLNDFTELPDKHVDLGVLFGSDDYAEWKDFRGQEDSRYVGLVAPHFLLREPYTPENYKAPFRFAEEVDGRKHDSYLWGNAAFAFAGRLTEAYFAYGWTSAIIGEKSGGRVSNLPLHRFDTDRGTREIKPPTETEISDPRWAELADQGFIPLVYKLGSNFATFYTAPSCQKPKVYDLPSATANARLSATLPYMFAASRFAHYLKVINRTELGTFKTRETLEAHLNRWIGNYVVGNDNASDDMKAAHPLREALIKVEDVEGKPGYYNAVAWLRPHLHLEGLTTSLRLVAQIPQKK
jgi:type VI secretion system protein ImpC